MNERYTAVAKFSAPQIQGDLPILLSAGNLLKDNVTGQMVAQLKFENIGEKIIRAMYVSFRCFDVMNDVIPGTTVAKYIDLNVKQGDFFADRVPVIMNDATTRSCKVRITDILYQDGSREQPADETEMEQVDIPSDPLTEDQREQMRNELNWPEKAFSTPVDAGKMIRCACGRWNLHGAEKCRACGSDIRRLLSLADPERLQRDLEEKRQEEARKREEKRRLEEERRQEERRRVKRQAKFKKTALKTVLAVVIIVSLIAVFIRFIYPLIHAEYQYRKAGKLAAQGDYSGAYAIYFTIRDYKDVDDLLKNDSNLKWQPGNTVKFGVYPQTSSGNDKTPIEWIVLDIQGDEALLISKYALDCKPYNKDRVDVTWETCTLRSWLNNEFYNKAFGVEDQQKIVKSKITADKNPSYRTNPGNDTTDNVFLLSITEADKYFKSNDARMCAPTNYAVKNGAWQSSGYYTADGSGACWWWLRSPGYYSDIAAGVNIDGSVDYRGDFVNYCDDSVRPCVWVRLF